jgi:hypothetical protein
MGRQNKKYRFCKCETPPSEKECQLCYPKSVTEGIEPIWNALNQIGEDPDTFKVKLQ